MNGSVNYTFGFLKRRFSVILWVLLVTYLFYDTFIAYNTGLQYRRLRNILGVGLCISRATASVLNASCALVLIPVCKKFNMLLYHVLARLWPRLFFFWVESSKSCHITLSTTLVAFAVVHSGAHFVNLWNFSKYYDKEYPSVNFADHKNQNPVELLTTFPVCTGVSMLFITILMACSSLRCVRRNHYNLFRYTHQLFFVFIALLLVHPLSGALKEEVIEDNMGINSMNTTAVFVPIKSKTWMWICLPLLCCSLDMLWRFCSRNHTSVIALDTTILSGRAMSLTLSCPSNTFQCRVGQYVLIQCSDISSLEWHPFSITKVPSYGQAEFGLLIKVKGDWTESLEQLVQRNSSTDRPLQFLMDGPYSSPLESMMTSEVAICVAAGVGITPFSSLMYSLLQNPRSRHPGRVHLIWIVRQECEIIWIAELATKALLQLREANRPDRLHIELYVTATGNPIPHTVGIDERGRIKHMKGYVDSEKIVLLTPKNRQKRSSLLLENAAKSEKPKILHQYPMLACRVGTGRPNWEKLFAYWIHLYPSENLPLYCCGPKKLTAALRHHCCWSNERTKTTINLIHEGFS